MASKGAADGRVMVYLDVETRRRLRRLAVDLDTTMTGLIAKWINETLPQQEADAARRREGQDASA